MPLKNRDSRASSRTLNTCSFCIMYVEAVETASLEKQQPQRVRARTQQLPRKQESPRLGWFCSGRACSGENSPGGALGVKVWEERGCEDRWAGGLGWEEAASPSSWLWKEQKVSRAERAGLGGARGLGGAGHCPWLTIRQSTPSCPPSGPPPGEQRGLSAHSFYFWVFVPAAFPAKLPTRLPGGESDPLPQGGSVTPGSLILS